MQPTATGGHGVPAVLPPHVTRATSAAGGVVDTFDPHPPRRQLLRALLPIALWGLLHVLLGGVEGWLASLVLWGSGIAAAVLAVTFVAVPTHSLRFDHSAGTWTNRSTTLLGSVTVASAAHRIEEIEDAAEYEAPSSGRGGVPSNANGTLVTLVFRLAPGPATAGPAGAPPRQWPFHTCVGQRDAEPVLRAWREYVADLRRGGCLEHVIAA